VNEPVPLAVAEAVSSTDENRVWVAACTEPFGKRDEIVPYLRRIAGGNLSDRAKVGGTAWILDETELAVRVLREALSQLRAPGVRGASGAVLSVLEWASSADLATATVAAMRGDHDQVAPLLAER
jgi:hypothetical protein